MAMANKPHRRYFGLHKDQPLDEINDRISFQYESTKKPDTSTSNVNMGRIISTFPEDFPDPTTEPISTTTTVANLYTSTLADATTIPVGGLKHNKQTNIDQINTIPVESTENYAIMKPKDIEYKPSTIQETTKNQSNIELTSKGENVKDLIDEVANNTSVNITKPGLNSRFGYNTDYILTPVATIQNNNLNVPANNFMLNTNGANYNQNNGVLLTNLGQGNPDAIKFPSDTPTDISNNPYPGNLNSGYVNSLPTSQTNVINNNPGYNTKINNVQTVPISFGSNQIQAVPVMGFLQNTGNNNNQGYTNIQMPNNGYNQITFPNNNAQIVNNGIFYPNNNNNYAATNYPQNQNYQSFAPPVVNNGQSNSVSNNGQLFQLVNVPSNNFNSPNVQSNNYYVPNTQNQFVNGQPTNTMQPGFNNNIVTFNNQNYQLVPLQGVSGNVANNQIPIMSNPQNVNYVGAGQSQVLIPNNGQSLNNNNQMLLVNNG
ncbi:putative uncharacterized protein DDB_G0282133 isoform X1 [Plutella xylostella]|uniref:putative uncharacterized protein DDB_G0282133 isoform X1 n=1 Tax=Plutella xylostella TaxID=51655 RepID=UPI002032789E|nr:putative uncharacterized protein DDB_G0282133 isoform X1 [Plutella xylostella]